MIPRIKEIKAIDDYKLIVRFDDDQTVIYNVSEDIDQIADFKPLKTEIGLFQNFSIDQSRTCVSWSDRIDLPSDTLLEYGKNITTTNITQPQVVNINRAREPGAEYKAGRAYR